MSDTNATRRRSARLSSSPEVSKMALKPVAVKRAITVRKIAPRKTVAPSEHEKENTPRLDSNEEKKKQKISTPSSSSPAEKEKSKKAEMPSPILPPSPPAQQHHSAAPVDEVWSQKVRRSYSRLSDKSLNSPNSRETLFGFEKLTTPEVLKGGRGARRAGLEVSAAARSDLNSFTSLLEADDCDSALPDQDTNIPGVVVVAKERRRRRKVPQMNSSELDAIAAKMNAEFDEAEVFELVVE